MQLGSRYNQHSFAQTPSIGLPRSTFDRSYEVKDTYDFDYIYPFYLDEVLPGDTFNVDANIFARLATQKVPIMDRLYASYEFFFVPARLVWTNFKKMMGEQDDPGDSTDYVVPTVSPPAPGLVWPALSLADHLGIVPGVAVGAVNALPFRCYNLIYNTWYRDQNLVNSVDVDLGDGPDDPADYVLRKRAKAHDYFTSALPWPQKTTAVNIAIEANQGTAFVRNAATGNVLTSVDLFASPGGALSIAGYASDGYIDPNGTLKINPEDIRLGMSLQELFERDARGGTRFPEVILAHFNTVLPDFTVQRPEFLGSGHFDINIHPVAQNSQTGTTPQGNLASFATHMVSGRALGFQKSFQEWGYVFGMVTFRSAITYQQGMNRLWLRSTRFDFYWPELANLGEQAIQAREIWAQAVTSGTNSVFGYQERYAEYKYKPSEVRGAFRSGYATSLDVWHMSEEFAAQPSLNQTFIESNTPIERSIVVTEGEPQIIFNAYIKQTCVRPMPVYNIPASFRM